VDEALVALGAALLAAGILARIGRRLELPTIPLFMLAGIIFGPNTPGLSIVSDPAELDLLATVGLVLLLFYLGLEFSLGNLIEGGTRLLTMGVLYVALNLGLGLAFGFALGWGAQEALVIAGVMGISSSAIATKLLVELRRLANPETRLILGIIVVEDIILAVYLALLQPILGETEGVGDALVSIGRAFAFLIVLGVVARKGAGLVGRLIGSDDDELLTICFVGLAVLVAGIAEELGVTEAIGAFMVGLILAESPMRDRIERLSLPLRDTFAAVSSSFSGSPSTRGTSRPSRARSRSPSGSPSCSTSWPG
jgi:K+:H+ antiporter subunit KhtU